MTPCEGPTILPPDDKRAAVRYRLRGDLFVLEARYRRWSAIPEVADGLAVMRRIIDELDND